MRQHTRARILYLNSKAQKKFGAGTHARELYRALASIKQIHINIKEGQISKKNTKKDSTGIRSLFRRLMPKTLVKWMSFWRCTDDYLLDDLRRLSEEYNAIYYRSDGMLKCYSEACDIGINMYSILELNALHHEESLQDIPFIQHWLKKESGLVKSFDLVIVVSSELKRKLENYGVDAEKILVVHNGVNVRIFDPLATASSEYREHLHIPDSAYLIGYIGGMEEFRNIPLMIREIVSFMEVHLDVHFLVAGGGKRKMVAIEQIKNLPKRIRDRVIFMGEVEHSLVPHILGVLDCAVYPYSNTYGSPQKLFEYLAMQVPTIGPDVPAVSEIFDDKEHMMLVDQSDNDFSHCLDAIYHDPALARMMASRGRELVISKYTWKHAAEKIWQRIKVDMEIRARD